MRVSPLRRLSLGGALALVAAGAAVACGPDFPNSYLGLNDTQLLAAPEGSFADEIARLLKQMPPTMPPFKVLPTSRDDVLKADVDDLRHSLAERGDSPDQVKAIGGAYAAAREQFEQWSRRHQVATQNAKMAKLFGQPPPDDTSKPEPAPVLSLPDSLPVEFRLYFVATEAWDNDQPDLARDKWAELLALPAAERPRRSVWAAFMLARAWAEEIAHAGSESAGNAAAAKAISYSRQTRSLATEGFSDPLGLAAASLGWEAKAALSTDNLDVAINLYLTEQAMGDPSAFESLRTAASRAANLPMEKLLALAQNPAGRAVLTSYLVAQGGNGNHPPADDLALESSRWAATLEKIGVHEQPEADRLAWVAYQGGLFALAQQWTALAPEKSAMAEWIRAQLALRAGNLPEGEKRLRSTLSLEGLSNSQRKTAFTELGRACLAQDRPADALTAWIKGSHGMDASYLAERVLKLDELRTYVDANCLEVAAPEKSAVADAGEPDVEGEYEGFCDWTSPNDVRAEICALLARRLARAEQYEAAEPYFSKSLRDTFHSYVADVRAGYDVARPAPDSAAAFWRAAQTIDAHGMELLGTELDPDWTSLNGIYVYDSGEITFTDERKAQRLAGGIFAPTPDELARLTASPIPSQRFHYRFRAADLAWWAASLMPNDSDETARILNEAGGWLKNRDAPAANRFYQALVIRCGNTTLGRAAAQKHWFPSDPPAK